MTTAIPYDWLRHIPYSLVEKSEFPIFGYPPPFPWDQFTVIFSKIFQLENAKITPALWEMRTGDSLYAGLGNQVLPLFLDLSPLEGNFCFVMAQNDVDRLMNLLLRGDASAPTIIDEEYRRGFHQFIALQAIDVFTKLGYAKGISPHLLEIADLPNGTNACLDISLEAGKATFIGRLIISQQLRQSWKERFAERSLTSFMPKQLSEKIQVIVDLEAGRTTLTKEEWNQAAVGDFLCIDHCSLEGEGEKGRVILSLNGKPLYRAKVKDGGVKILESPMFHEIHTHPQPNQEVPLPDTFDEEFTDFDEDFSEIESVTSEAAVAPPKPAAAPPAAKIVPPGEASKPAQKSSEPAVKPVAGIHPAPSVQPIHLEDVPITIVIEVGRIQISVQKLMELEPGSLLDLDIHPENGVDLVVHGNVIGKGELLKIGDSLGVRILDKV